LLEEDKNKHQTIYKTYTLDTMVFNIIPHKKCDLLKKGHIQSAN